MSKQVEVRAVRGIGGGNVEACKESDAHMFSVYSSVPDGTEPTVFDWVADFAGKDLALIFAEVLAKNTGAEFFNRIES